MASIDLGLLLLLAGLTALLGGATVWILRRRPLLDPRGDDPDTASLVARLRAWWLMLFLFLAILPAGEPGALLVFTLVSFAALREYLTLTPTRREDHRPLVWALLVITPWQYAMLAFGSMGMFFLFIPVYAFLFIPIRQALAGETRAFLERTSKVQWGLMVCVFFVSHVPALLHLEIAGYSGQNPKLILFLVLLVQASDLFQFLWGRAAGRRPLLPALLPSQTVEGFLGGIASTTLLGAALSFLTPFHPLQAAAFAFLIALMGFFGRAVMTAIKRDRGIAGPSSGLPGQAGMLDRIDSLCFAAPVFFHAVRFFFDPGP